MKQSLIKRIKNNQNHAVSEVVGTILLLGISVTLFSVIYTSVLSIPYTPPTPNSNIAYSLHGTNLTLANVGGKPLELDTEVRILINDALYKSYKVGDYLDASKTNWGMGEQLIFDLSGYISETEYSVEVQVIDVNSNSIVMMGKTSIKNRPPIISSPDPYIDETNVASTLTRLNITISEPDNDAFRWTIETTPNIGSNSGLMQVYTENNFHCVVSGLLEDINYIWYVNATDINGKSTEKTFTFTTGMAEPTVEHKDAIDDNSIDVDSSADIGTETNFNNCKANETDTNVMIIKEYRPPKYNDNDTVDDNTCNAGSPTDVGTESGFNNSKDVIPDTDVMTLTEANQGTAQQVTYQSAGAGVGGVSTSLEVPYPSSPAANDLFVLQVYVEGTTQQPTTPSGWTSISGPNTIYNSRGRAWAFVKYSTGSESGTLTVSGFGTGGIGKYARMYSFRNVATTSGWENVDWETSSSTTDIVYDNSVTTSQNKGYAVNLVYIYDDSAVPINFADETGGDFTELVAEFKDTSSSDATLQIQGATMTTAGTVNGGSYDQGNADESGVIGFALKPKNTIDYELDFEYQFNNTNFISNNEQVCFYLTGSLSENLVVDYWSGSWIGLGTITHSGWTNFTAKGLTSSTYNIRIRDQNQTDELTQHSWNIDCMFLHTWNNSDYQIDFEYQFTGAIYSDTHETLCIYITSRTGTEPLNINYWDGDSWESLGTITGTGWKNVIATGLTSSIYTIQLTGSTETSDTEQGDWSIDCIYLHTWDD